MGHVTELDEIATFVRVVEAQGFSAAAESLGVPKSTVSRRVARLEERLDVRLLHRTTRQMRPTPEGQAFFEQVAPAIATLKEAAVQVSEGNDIPRGVLRITAPVDFGHAHLADAVASFSLKYPEVEVQVELGGAFVDLVNDGLDLAIRGGQLGDTSLVARKLGTTEFWLMAAPSYLDRRGRPTVPSDLAAHDCLLLRPDNRPRVWQLEGPEGPAEVSVTSRVGADGFAFLCRVAAAGAGIAKLPAFLPSKQLADGVLERVLPDYHFPGAPLQLVYPTTRQLPAKTRAFRDHLIASIADQPWAGVG